MHIKPGVIALSVHPAILYALDIVDKTWLDLAKRHATITSLQDSDAHKADSLHYGKPGDARCRAVDLRTNDLDKPLLDRIVANLHTMLGDAYDIVLEGDHLHIEYDPYQENHS
jgi:hypothetical protein